MIKESISLSLIGLLKRKLQDNHFKRKWRRINKHNDTLPKNIFPISCVKVGAYSYGDLNVVTFSENCKLTIGNFVSIAGNVTFLLDVEHYLNHISTFPYLVKVVHSFKSESFSKGNIIIEDDVWIGYGATIMSGVHIGRGAVIAAGALVTKDVAPYAIVGGIPAKVIKFRFKEEIIDKLLTVDYSRIKKELIVEHIDDLYLEINDIWQLNWLPKNKD